MCGWKRMSVVPWFPILQQCANKMVTKAFHMNIVKLNAGTCGQGSKMCSKSYNTSKDQKREDVITHKSSIYEIFLLRIQTWTHYSHCDFCSCSINSWSLTSVRANPSQFVPNHVERLWARGSLSASPIPQILSLGLASTRVDPFVSRRTSRR